MSGEPSSEAVSDTPETQTAAAPEVNAAMLLATVLVIATCGLVYELLAGTLASYVLGDSITQFSTIIGVYLSAMGLGAHLSKYVDNAVARRFVDVELAVALVGGLSAPLLFFAFAELSYFRVVLYGLVTLVGTLVGLEIPLLLRILETRYSFKELIARVLAFDYVGALVASLLFPIFLVPKLGLVRTSLAFGLLNALVGLWSTYLLKDVIGRVRGLQVKALAVSALLLAGLVFAEELTTLTEDGVYGDDIVFARSTPYQRVVMTRAGQGFQLFLSGNLQFASADEYRYHESLVHPAMALRPDARRVLVLGGGDGLAVRELLKYPGIEEITLVDLDPEMTQLARTHPMLRELNADALWSPKVTLVHDDAYLYVQQPRGPYDVAIVDFPDPNNFSLGKLYTQRFYSLLRRSLVPGAPVAVQSTSPLMARTAFWCIVRTMEAAGFHTHPYHALVPSFGEWGFVLARTEPFDPPRALAVEGLSYLTDETLPALFAFPPDMGPLPVEVNRLNSQMLVHYYEADWRRWN